MGEWVGLPAFAEAIAGKRTAKLTLELEIRFALLNSIISSFVHLKIFCLKIVYFNSGLYVCLSFQNKTFYYLWKSIF